MIHRDSSHCHHLWWGWFGEAEEDIFQPCPGPSKSLKAWGDLTTSHASYQWTAKIGLLAENLPLVHDTYNLFKHCIVHTCNRPSEDMAERFIIDLDVGGTRFRTTWQTILSEPDSLLAKVFNSQAGLESLVKIDGAYFIDRDPVYFRVGGVHMKLFQNWNYSTSGIHCGYLRYYWM